MRTGVLSDAHIRKHSAELFPLDAYTHENLYGQPHLEARNAHEKETGESQAYLQTEGALHDAPRTCKAAKPDEHQGTS